jgi:hypothetical protein
MRLDAQVSDEAKEDVTGNGNDAALVIRPGTHGDLQRLGKKRRAMFAKQLDANLA